VDNEQDNYNENRASAETKIWINERMDRWEELVDEIKEVLNTRELSYRDTIDSVRDLIESLKEDFDATSAEFEERGQLL